MGVAVQGLPHKLTVEEYSKLPEVAGFKDELIEGERVLSPMAKFSHGVVLDNLQSLLKEQFPHMEVVRETGWRFRSEDGLIASCSGSNGYPARITTRRLGRVSTSKDIFCCD